MSLQNTLDLLSLGSVFHSAFDELTAIIKETKE